MADSLLELIAARERITFLENRLRAIEANARIAVDPAPSADRHTTPADERRQVCNTHRYNPDAVVIGCGCNDPAPATPAGPEEWKP